jgi:hypothetical protein
MLYRRLVTTCAVQVSVRQDGQAAQVGQSVSSTVTASASAGRISQLPTGFLWLHHGYTRYHRRRYPRNLKPSLFTLRHLGGLINRPVQIVGG